MEGGIMSIIAAFRFIFLNGDKLEEILMNKPKAIFIALFCSIIITQALSYPRKAHETVDLSEKILKIYRQRPNRFGEKGFGVYDSGESKYKCFDWNLNIVKTIPVTIGEGPGEVKPYLYNACLYKNSLFVNGFLDSKIHVYQLEGKYLKSITLDFAPRFLCTRGDRLYAFNSEFYTSTGAALASIIHMGSGEKLRTVKLKTKINIEDNAPEGVLQRMFLFDVDESGNIYVLNVLCNELLRISRSGEVLDKISLPRSADIKFNTTKADDGTVIVSMSMWEHFRDFKVIGGMVYLCFLKTEKYDRNTNTSVYSSYLVQHPLSHEGGGFKEKKFSGNLTFLGVYDSNIYLFDLDEYRVILCRTLM